MIEYCCKHPIESLDRSFRLINELINDYFNFNYNEQQHYNNNNINFEFECRSHALYSLILIKKYSKKILNNNNNNISFWDISHLY